MLNEYKFKRLNMYELTIYNYSGEHQLNISS